MTRIEAAVLGITCGITLINFALLLALFDRLE